MPEVCWVYWGHLQLEGFVGDAAVAVLQRVVHGCVCVFVRMAVVYVPMNL